ncbi:tripartite tricarboxylate transporter TctB family protein [Nocardioides sp. HDW12B]|uniref:tripartite tricarboxylate transporter TctB family protein n=1 Tax=Nocardioides sp. HDW12B TaxID=2714939 RepID=UPI00140E70F9|nr:tripartite tricarboxylate transporter TctB family protein [Nocardioides sp. HDW12B]QIK67356.1 tripartite tricarboxylate transporter TctB family protein [Nocardioides sp. HDW12B]
MALSQLLRRADTDPEPDVRREPLVVRVAPELVTLALVAVLWPATVSLDSAAGGPGPAFFPQVLLAVLALASVGGLVVEARRSRGGAAPATAVSEVPGPGDPGLGSEDEGEETDLRRALQAAGLVLGYVAAIAVMGWVLASTLFALVFLWLSGHRKPWALLGVALVAPQVLAYLFVKIVYIALPTGVGVFDTVTVFLYRVFGIY